MNAVLEQRTETDVTPPKAALTTLAATGAKVTAIVPQNLDQAWRLAKAITLAGWAPKGYQNKDGSFNEEMVAVGILHGMEVGFTPIAALQSIAVINGMPSIFGDGALALVMNSGLIEDFKETPIKDASGKVTGYHFWAKRRGRATPIEQQFTVEDAEKAGLKGKPGPWTQYPARMLQMRARSWGLRDGFPDVLRGLKIAEEVLDITPELVGSTTARPPATLTDDRKPMELPVYPDEGFAKNLPKWRELIAAGKKTADDIIATVSAKHQLDDAQRAQIRGDVATQEGTQ